MGWKFNNKIVQFKYSFEDHIIIGVKEYNEHANFYSSDIIDSPIANIRELNTNKYGKHLYEQDYANYRKLNLIKSPTIFQFLDIEILTKPTDDMSQVVKNYNIPVTCCSITEFTDGISRNTQFVLEDFKKEEYMLKLILKKISQENVATFCWHARFDIDYILGRYSVLTGETYQIYGPCLDYRSLYKKYYKQMKTLQSDTLEFTLQEHLGEGKLKFEGSLYDLYHNNRELYYQYNREDTNRLVLLERKLKVVKICSHIVKVSNCLWQDLLFNTVILENLIYHKFLKPNGWTFKNKIKFETPFEYPGAIVYEPIGGIYKNTRCYDFVSLYPTVMAAFNISPETFCIEKPLNDPFIITCQGTCYLKDSYFAGKNNSLYKMIVNNLMDSRMRVGKKTSEGKAYKTLANSLYGACGSYYFRFANKTIAGDITQQAKNVNINVALNLEILLKNKQKKIIILKTNDVVKDIIKAENRSQILWGHTDSVFVNSELNFTKYINKFIIPEYYKSWKIQPEMYPIQINDEYGLIPAIMFRWRVKANYYILKQDGELKCVGGTIVRSNTNKASIMFTKLMVKRLLQNKVTPDQILSYIKNFHQVFDPLDPIFYTPYNVIIGKDYKSIPRGITGLNNLKLLYPDHINNENRGVIVEMVAPNYNKKTGKMLKPSSIPLSIPEKNIKNIKRILLNADQMGWRINLDKINQKIFTPIYDILKTITP